MSLTTLDGLEPEETPRNLGGRPSIFTPEIAKEICDRIALGESVISITRDAHMPCELTVYRWVNDDREGFGKDYADARLRQAWRYQDEIMDIADDGSNDFVERVRKDGSTETVFDAEHYQRSRLRVDSRKWYLSKVLPKVFGDKVQHEHSGDVNVNLRGKSDAELVDALAKLQARVAARVATDVEDESVEEVEDGDEHS